MSDQEETAQPRKKAVAVQYDRETMIAPKIIAKGQGIVADNIVEQAVLHKVPVYQNKSLASMLMALELDREIPPELYKAVAEVLVFVYQADSTLGRMKNR